MSEGTPNQNIPITHIPATPSMPKDTRGYVSARAAWEVRGGLVPGKADEKHTKRWGLTSDEWASPLGAQILLDRQMAAHSYALGLTLLCAQGFEVNWVETTFIWF